jgi:hypothetical protein
MIAIPAADDCGSLQLWRPCRRRRGALHGFQQAKPFLWTTDPDRIIEKVNRGHPRDGVRSLSALVEGSRHAEPKAPPDWAAYAK